MCDSDRVIDVADKVSAFQNLLSSAGSKYVYAFFYSKGCGHCDALMPYVGTFRNRCISKQSNAIIVFINRQTASELFQAYNVTSFPQVMVFRGGKLVKHIKGNDQPAVAQAFALAGL